VPDVLTRFGTGFLTLMLSPAPLAFYRLMVSTGAQIPGVTEMWFENGPKRMIAGVAAFIAARSRTGELDVPDPIAAAELFLMSMRGVVHLQAVTGLIKPPFDAAIAAKVKAAVDMFMRAYGRKPPVRAPRRPRP
jgi:TetR/AcrR family transcriptional repressor of mexJK operon